MIVHICRAFSWKSVSILQHLFFISCLILCINPSNSSANCRFSSTLRKNPTLHSYHKNSGCFIRSTILSGISSRDIDEVAFVSPSAVTLPSATSKISHHAFDDVNGAYDRKDWGIAASTVRFLNETTNGWLLEYADLRPHDPTSIIGKSFLATNVLYVAAGTINIFREDYLFGLIILTAGILSSVYHYLQLHLGPKQLEVEKILVCDNIVALLAVITTVSKLILYAHSSQLIPWEPLSIGLLSLVFFGAGCWKYNFGMPYIVVHSLWHILSGLFVISVGNLRM